MYPFKNNDIFYYINSINGPNLNKIIQLSRLKTELSIDSTSCLPRASSNIRWLRSMRMEIPLAINQEKVETNVSEHMIFMNKGFARNYQAELPNDHGKYFAEMELNWDNGDSAPFGSMYIVE